MEYSKLQVKKQLESEFVKGDSAFKSTREMAMYTDGEEQLETGYDLEVRTKVKAGRFRVTIIWKRIGKLVRMPLLNLIIVRLNMMRESMKVMQVKVY